jgi:hypothetical protein
MPHDGVPFENRKRSAGVHEAGLWRRLQASQYAVLPKPFSSLKQREAGPVH